MAKKRRPKSTDGIKRGGFHEEERPKKNLGNEWWKLRAKHGRDKLFKSPELLWEAACDYFAHVSQNPLKESMPFAFQGKVTIEEVSKMRAYSLPALCLYLGCSNNYFSAFKSLHKDDSSEEAKGFLVVISMIDQVMFSQKFEGASAGLLNANIISRDLGLVDKQETKMEMPDPKIIINVNKLSADENG